MRMTAFSRVGAHAPTSVDYGWFRRAVVDGSGAGRLETSSTKVVAQMWRAVQIIRPRSLRHPDCLGGRYGLIRAAGMIRRARGAVLGESPIGPPFARLLSSHDFS
jgi:hypothetical protein